MIKSVVATVAAAALAGVPVMASAAPAANPAARLSVASNVRAGATQQHAGKLGGGFGLYTIILVAALAGLVVAIVDNDDDGGNGGGGTPASR